MTVGGHPNDNYGWFDWAYKGVDHSFTGNGGPECRDFLSIPQRWLESIAACVLSVIAIVYSWPGMNLPQSYPCSYRRLQEPLGKRVLLIVMCLTFGVELGFKFATRQMIWVANPCHIVTMMQIFILAAPPGRVVTTVFRVHMHMLTGAPIAILFPVINTRLLPFETEVYFLQHILMLVIPFYLLYAGDPFIPEALGDFSWAWTSLGLLYIYHFGPLQLLAYVSQANLNNMLCPAVSDPFHGQFYRTFALGHQTVIILFLGKLVVITARILQIMPHDNSLDVAKVCSCAPDCSCHSTVCCLPCINKEICPASRSESCGADCRGDCAGTTPMLNKSNKTSVRNCLSKCFCCGQNYNPSTSDISSHRTCSSNSREFACDHNKQAQYSTHHNVNGNLVRDGKTNVTYSRKRLEETANIKQISSESRVTDTDYLCNSYQTRSSYSFFPEEDSKLSQTHLVFDQQKSQNSHAKSH